MFFPSSTAKIHRERAEALRRLFSIEEDSVLNGSAREVRNFYQHIDEKLDKMSEKSIREGSPLEMTTNRGVSFNAFQVGIMDKNVNLEEEEKILLEAQKIIDKIHMHVPAYKNPSW